MKICLTILFFIVYLLPVHSQTDTFRFKIDTLPQNYFKLREVERDGVTLPEMEIKEVVILGRASNSKKFPAWRYERLVYNLKRVYPYALLVRARLEQVNKELELIPDEKERKRFLRDTEKDVFREYEDDIRDMTITQGKLLIKLIDRETQNTSYELIRDYRGSFSAAFWQGIARIFGTNLKAEYDPIGEDALLERILTEIESGRL